MIPARGGSKRIPGKNIRPFAGRPMMAHTIDAARESGCFDRIVLSSDDEETMEVAKALGVEVPFVRPAAIADDHATTAAVIAHAVEWFSTRGEAPEAVCCLYATAPMMAANDIRAALDLLVSTGCDFAFPVTSYAFPIQRAVRLTADGRMAMFQPDAFHTRSQDLDPAYHDAGQFYWGRPEAWLRQEPVFGPRSTPLVIARRRVQDIDTPEDWSRAELMWQALNAPGGGT